MFHHDPPSFGWRDGVVVNDVVASVGTDGDGAPARSARSAGPSTVDSISTSVSTRNRRRGPNSNGGNVEHDDIHVIYTRMLRESKGGGWHKIWEAARAEYSLNL
jgi:hypothetical protein